MARVARLPAAITCGEGDVKHGQFGRCTADGIAGLARVAESDRLRLRGASGVGCALTPGASGTSCAARRAWPLDQFLGSEIPKKSKGLATGRIQESISGIKMRVNNA